jgi:hypothetical protein
LVDEKEFFDCMEYLEFDDHVDDLLDSLYPATMKDIYVAPVTTVERSPNFELLCPLFG